MRNAILSAAALALAIPAFAQEEPQGEPSPAEIVNAASPDDWLEIKAEDLLVMTLAPAPDGAERTVVIQLMPAPFSQGWVENIKTLARTEWYDGISVNRVQDNYVVQWGDPGYDNPESGEVEQKALPEGLNVMGESDYTANLIAWMEANDIQQSNTNPTDEIAFKVGLEPNRQWRSSDAYAPWVDFYAGWPVAQSEFAYDAPWWPTHCYGMVGVGRSYSPDTGSGAELYTVIGHAPRHLDRNIALVGRIISGMEHLSSLPRGTGQLGFYSEEEAHLRVPILSVRVAADLPEDERPLFEYLSTESDSFARYAEARANRRDPFFIVPAGGADICNIPVPVRAFEYADEE